MLLPWQRRQTRCDGAPDFDVTFLYSRKRKTRGYLYADAVARLYGDGAVFAVIIVAVADLHLKIPSHVTRHTSHITRHTSHVTHYYCYLQRLRLFWTYIFSVHSRVKGDMLLFHRYLNHGAIKTQNPRQNVPQMRQSTHHAPGQCARNGRGGCRRPCSGNHFSVFVCNKLQPSSSLDEDLQKSLPRLREPSPWAWGPLPDNNAFFGDILRSGDGSAWHSWQRW